MLGHTDRALFDPNPDLASVQPFRSSKFLAKCHPEPTPTTTTTTTATTHNHNHRHNLHVQDGVGRAHTALLTRLGDIIIDMGYLGGWGLFEHCVATWTVCVSGVQRLLNPKP